MSSQGTLFDVPLTPRFLTVRQPWAWAIFHAGKDVENRTWPTSYRGPLLIAAGRRVDPEGFKMLEALGVEVPDLSEQMGVIAGLVQVEDCMQGARSPWAFPEVWHWRVAAAKPATARVQCRGALGLVAAPGGWAAAFS